MTCEEILFIPKTTGFYNVEIGQPYYDLTFKHSSNMGFLVRIASLEGNEKNLADVD